MSEIKTCPNGHKVHVNPKKHEGRAKLCPTCRGKLTKPKKGLTPNQNWRKSRIMQRIYRVKVDGRIDRLKTELIMIPPDERREVIDEYEEMKKHNEWKNDSKRS